jgi:sialate O-acetylesterase
MGFTSLRQRGALVNVPEASEYALVYSLDIPNTPNYSGGITYTLDQRTNIAAFSRVAYYLELQPSGGPLDFIWVSMDAFTNNVNRIGVPTVSSGGIFQQNVANMNVLSSVASIVNGTNIQTGNLEFWPYNFSATNTANVLNASSTTLDWGDSRGTSGSYGSMQIANYGTSQILFSFNRWGGTGGNADLGIGNATTGANPDWTFAQNAATYAVKTLQVFVLPSFKVTAVGFPTPGQFSLSWEASPGTSYSVWRKLALEDASWTKVGTVTATNNPATFSDSAAGNVSGFYQISTP